jgi:phage protein U
MDARVTIRDRSRPGRKVVARLHAGVPEVTGYGGWEEVPRPKRRGFPDWQGQPLLRMAIPLCLDGLPENRSVQPRVNRLEAMSSVRGERKHPPTIAIKGPVPHTRRVWVIEDIEWGDSLRNRRGVLVRQEFTLMLLQWQDSDVVVKRHRKRSGDKKSNRKVKARQRNSSETLVDIADLNGLRDPRALDVGQELRLP